MGMLLQLLASGVMVGALYGMIALGFNLVNKASGIFNMAVGEMAVVGAFLTWTGMIWIGLSFWPSLILGLAISALLGLVIERLTLRPLIGKPLLSSVMMTMTLSLLLGAVATLIWSAQDRSFPSPFPTQGVVLGDVVLSPAPMAGFFASIIILAGLVSMFRYTRIGLTMRAANEDHYAAAGIGISISRILAIVWVICAILTTVSGVLLASTSVVSVRIADIGMKAMPAAVLAGMESIPGAIFAGMILGIAEALAGGYLDPIVGGGTQVVFPFIVMVFVLLIRPYGLMGLKKIERV